MNNKNVKETQIRKIIDALYPNKNIDMELTIKDYTGDRIIKEGKIAKVYNDNKLDQNWIVVSIVPAYSKAPNTTTPDYKLPKIIYVI